MNTIKHYLEQIKDPEVRERALRNAEESETLYMEEEDAQAALFAAFVFDETPEGWDCWYEIYSNINQYI